MNIIKKISISIQWQSSCRSAKANLSRVFKKRDDYTFTIYLSYYRMKVAMELLKEGNLKVYEVADAAGYSDTAYFSAQFKKIVGIAPSEYQDRVRGH